METGSISGFFFWVGWGSEYSHKKKLLLKVLVLSVNEKYLTQFLQHDNKVARQPKPVEIVQILCCTTNQILRVRFSSGEGSVVVFWLGFCVQVVRAVATASPIHVDGNEVVERLLLHISSSPRRLSCRSCAVDSGFSSAGLRPCDWKLGKVLSSLHTFVCSHPVEFRYASQQVGRFFWALAKLFRFSSEVLCHQEIKSFDYHRRH
jgi:hypothetical protein